jgi:hypothetical protein
MKVTQAFLITFYLIALTGCATNTTPPPTTTPTPIPPTETHTLTPTSTFTPTSTSTNTPTVTPTFTITPTATDTQTPSPTLTATDTPTPTETPTETITPTPVPPTVTAIMDANCRYGPGKAYLFAYGFYEGYEGKLKGRNETTTWLWIQPEGLSWSCWVAASTVTASVELDTVPVVWVQLYVHPDVPAPSGVTAHRSGQKVIISWNPAPPAIELAYLIEARICSGGFLYDVAYSTTNTSYTITDETSCARDSYGQLRVSNKLGYGPAVSIPWP